MQSYALLLMTTWWMLIELMTLDIYGMGYGKIAERVA